MNYKIEKNIDAILALRYDLEFTIYKSVRQVKSNLTCEICDLEKYIVEDQPDKPKRTLVHFNPFKEGRKSKAFALLPHTCMVDVDFKGKDIKIREQNLMKDMDEPTFDLAYNKLIKRFQSDPCCLYFDTSHSGKGIKALYSVVSDYYVENFDIYKPDGIMCDTLMKENYTILTEYLSDKLNITARKGGEGAYIDVVGNRITQGIYTSWGRDLKINPLAHVLKYKLKDYMNSYVGDPVQISYTDIELKKLNNKFSKEFIPYMKELYNNFINGDDDSTKQYNLIVNKMKEMMSNYSPALPILFTLKYLDETYLVYWYGFFRNLYQGGSIPLNNYNLFREFIFRIDSKFAIPLSNLINYTKLKKNLNTDLFNNKYTETIEYTDWVSEHKNELFDFFDENNEVFIKAEAGGGKTTLLVEYGVEKLKTMKKVVLVIPKNSLLEQQYHIIKMKYPKLPISRNFGRYYHQDEEGLILSSTPKLHKIKNVDLIIVDETQNLVNYASEIISNIKQSCKKIFISATPEKYLIYERNYFYINLHKKDETKKRLIKYISKQHNEILKILIHPGRKQLIFYNNLDESVRIFTKKEFGVDFTFINSPKKHTIEAQDIILNQRLKDNHYVITSFLTDGINFNNTIWDDIIIVENGTVSADEIYQLSNRFRNLLKPLNTILISKPRHAKHSGGIDFNKFKNYEYYKDRIKNSLEWEQKLNNERWRNENVAMIKSPNFIKKGDRYYFNQDSVKLEIYRTEFLDKYYIYQDVMDYGLEYYFDVINVFRIEKKNHDFVNRNPLNKLFLENIDIISITLVFMKDPIWLKDPISNFPKNLIDIVTKEFSYFKKLSMRIVEINECDGDIKKSILPGNSYTTYIKRLRKKKLGDTENTRALDGLDKYYWNRQEDFVKLIKDKCVIEHYKTRQNEFDYVSVESVNDIFKNDFNQMERFVDECKEYDFSCNEKGIGKYMSAIGRHLERKQLRNGVKVYRFKI